MPFSTTNPVSVGLATRADHYNTVFDNTLALRAGELALTSQAALDFIYASSATQLARLAKGTGLQYLRMNAGATAYEFATLTQPHAFVYHNGTQAVATTAATVLTFDSEVLDTNGFHDNVTNNGRLTVPTGLGGIYVVFAVIPVESAQNPIIRVSLRLNGAGQTAGQITKGPSSTSQPLDTLTLVHLMSLAAGDYVDLVVENSAADSVTFGGDAAARRSRFGCLRVSL